MKGQKPRRIPKEWENTEKTLTNNFNGYERERENFKDQQEHNRGRDEAVKTDFIRWRGAQHRIHLLHCSKL